MKTKPNPNLRTDDFTFRLLNVFNDLALRGAFHKKAEFSTAAVLTASNFSNIQYGIRNYPDIAERKKQVIINLYELYGVNPEYMKGASEKMYLREPKQVAHALPAEAQQLNFRNKEEKMKIIKERDEYKTKYEEAEERIHKLEEELAAYKMIKKTDKANPKNPDKHPDK